MWTILLLLLLAVAHSASGQACGPFGISGETSSGHTCTVPTSQFCECECSSIDGLNGYIGWQGGQVPGLNRFENPCGTNTNYNDAGYGPGECSNHCGFDARATVCMGNGVPDWTQSFSWQFGFAGNYIDASTAGLRCYCDPGFYGTRITVFPCNDPSSNVCPFVQYTVHQNCLGIIRIDFCSNRGFDISGTSQPRGVIPCPATYNVNGLYNGQGIWGFGCSTSYRSDDTLSSLVCLCDQGFIFGSPGRAGQCSRTVRDAVCSGNGQDSCSSCRYAANTPLQGTGSPTCTCDQFYGTRVAGLQCFAFMPCFQTLPCGGAGVGSCTSTQNSCVCTGPTYGGRACCPVKYQGNPSLDSDVCNGFASACQSNSQCNCPAGFQSPGCCPQCDPSQTCQLDGRCTCPVISGLLCGPYGSCVDGAVKSCTCRSARTTLSDGTIANATLGGLYCCPVLAGNSLCGGGICTSYTIAIDPANPLTSLSGTCTCPAIASPYQRQGLFCCPFVPGRQTTPCGPFGVCQPDGTCKCQNSRISGAACEVNNNCATSANPGECSGAGLCLPQTAGSFGLGDYLTQLQFNDAAGVAYTTNDSVVIQDEGIINFQREVYKAFLGFDPATKRNESAFYQRQCPAGSTTRGLCLWNLLVACQPQRDALIAATPGGVAQYLQNAMKVIDPNQVSLFTSNAYEQQLEAAFSGSSCSGQGLPREGMASLMLWDLWTFLYRSNPAIPITSSAVFNINPGFVNAPWQCVCSAPAPGGKIGSDIAVGGPHCEFSSCPLGSNNQPCSGWNQGVFQGYCVGSGQCSCSPKFIGHACNVSLTPGCYPVGSTDPAPCSNGHGICSSSGSGCNCNSQFTGQYCELSRCQAPGVAPQPGECNSFGSCIASTLTCDCSSFLYDTGSQSNVPTNLPTGNACERNGQSACGIFVQNPVAQPGIGNWQVCSNHGSCLWNYTSGSAACSCTGNTFGPQCQNSACLPLCNAHETCNLLSGGCNCLRFWSTPSSCATPNRTCECSVHLCGNGFPSDDGSSCICNPGWKKAAVGPTAGTCVIVQCPLTVYTAQGVRPCGALDTLCTDLSSITDSLDRGCCVDTCPSCSLNATSGVRTCDCNSLSGFAACYAQQSGICFPICHGSDELLPFNPPNCDSTSAPGSILCHCDFVALGPSQFRDLRCQRYTCINGGSPIAAVCNPQSQSCCNCAHTAYTGAFCAISACGESGTPSADGSSCICTAPFYRSGTSPLCDANHCTPGIAFKSSLGSYTCNCPANTFTANDSLSCRTLDCKVQDASLCSTCKNGGIASLFAGQINCDCTGTGFTGDDCSTIACLNGGTANAGVCSCVAPFTGGQFCSTIQCFNGGRASASACTCPIQWTGIQCQVASGRIVVTNTTNTTATSSSSSTGSSSSSSTGEVSQAASASNALTIGLGVGIPAGVLALGGAGYLIYTTLTARAALAAAAATTAKVAALSTAGTNTAVAIAMTGARYERSMLEEDELLLQEIPE